MRTYRAVVVGGGFIGEAHVEALRRLGNVEVAAVCDASDPQGKARKLGLLAGCGDYREAISRFRPDVLHICTPNQTHYEIAACAIRQGIHVVCEKPFTTTVQQAEDLIRLARENQVKGLVNFHNRLYPMPNQMREMVRQNRIGEVVTVHGSYVQDWLLYRTDYSWRLDSSQAGRTRAVADIGSHWMDLAEFVTGRRIREVCALFSTIHPYRERPSGSAKSFSSREGEDGGEDVAVDTEDAAMILMRFDNKAIGSLTVSQVFAGKKNALQICVGGKEASLIWDSDQLGELWIGRRDEANQLLTKDASLLSPHSAGLAAYPGGHMEGFPDAFKQAFAQFYRGLEETGPDGRALLAEEGDIAGFEDGLHQVRLCDAIWESASAGTWRKVQGL